MAFLERSHHNFGGGHWLGQCCSKYTYLPPLIPQAWEHLFPFSSHVTNLYSLILVSVPPPCPRSLENTNPSKICLPGFPFGTFSFFQEQQSPYPVWPPEIVNL